MAKIKFSHAYAKLNDSDGKPVKQATLIQVFSVAHETLTPEFLNYDTENGKYALKFDTLYLMLMFLKPNGEIFTTMRPQFGQFGNKREYYQNLVGHVFEIILQ